MRIVSAAQMRELEQRAEAAGISTAQLMENAGLAVAREVADFLGGAAGRRVLVLVGPGNNGGDGLVAARHLHDWGAAVQLYLLRPRSPEDTNYRKVEEQRLPVAVATDDPGYRTLAQALATADVVVDALLGTGSARPIEGPLAEVLNRARDARRQRPQMRVAALDLPTGLDCDSGAVDPHCLPADLTVTLGYSKVGLHVLPGSQLAGRVKVVDIGIPSEAAADLPWQLLAPKVVAPLLPPRPPDANKGTFGRVLVVGGSVNYVGAPCLAALGAARVGAGLVTLACPRTIYPTVAAKVSEATFLPLPDSDGMLTAEGASTIHQALRGYDVLLMGCGLGQGGPVRSLIRTVLSNLGDIPLKGIVLDADALNGLARTETWWEMWGLPTVLTPHPGEMSRLCGLSIPDVQAHRLGTALHFAAQWGKVVALKGANSVIAAPDGRAFISPFANPALASGGTGDVLAGAIAGLLAQGLEPSLAAAVGVFLHGLAGEEVRRQLGEAGAIAGDLLPQLPRAMQRLREEEHEPREP